MWVSGTPRDYDVAREEAVHRRGKRNANHGRRRLVRRASAWHGRRMTSSPSSPEPLAGGFPIAAGVILGVAIGLIVGQATLGFFIGLAAGVGIAVALWLRSRT